MLYYFLPIEKVPVIFISISSLATCSCIFYMYLFVFSQRINRNGKQDLNPSVQELAARAASLAKAEAAKNISPPNSAYQFEVSWRGLSGDRNLQVKLLKV